MVSRRSRNSVLSLFMVATICFLATQMMLPAFLQPKAPKSEEAIATAPAALGLATALATSVPAEALTGPLTGSEICRSKPLVYFIYPLCDPIFLVSPIYCAPLALIFFSTLVTVINLAIPATQPDEDLRV
eukprot:TRINITY_DN3008_c1_g1_i1.p1 TRINITY_DN3008_c1_g1~~TRINITY_DN3008_c1_g1_i1.p1  ORF type:complete len:130 (+),score=32.36 TRINITY_DN3008_c1_g1_i1:74-463(+)